MLMYTSIQEVTSMKVLFIGGTGGVHQIIADINDEKTVADAIRDLTFDAVCEFIGFRVPEIERDYRLFNG